LADEDPDDCGEEDWLEPESEHPAAIGIKVAAARASAVTLMPHRYPHLLVITGCTVAAPPLGNHRTRGELCFLVCNSYQMLVALLRQFVRPYRWPVAAVMGLQLVSTLASLYLPTVNAAIIDDGIAKGDSAAIVRLGG
jgi:hypothetical protein